MADADNYEGDGVKEMGALATANLAALASQVTQDVAREKAWRSHMERRASAERACEREEPGQQAVDLVADLRSLDPNRLTPGAAPFEIPDLNRAKQLAGAVRTQIDAAECELADLQGKPAHLPPEDSVVVNENQTTLNMARRWLRNWEQAVSDEEQCRQAADDSCAAKPICDAIYAKKQDLAAIAKEKANPAGVVDLKELHDLGEMVQDQDKIIDTYTKAFPARRHKKFSAATMCTSLAQP